MTPPSLDYAPPTPRQPRRPKTRLVLLIALALFLTATILETASERTVEAQMDAVTGTTKWKTTWHFGITSDVRTDTSPLEARLTTSNIAWTPSWRSVHFSLRNFHGTTGVQCATAPPILELRPILKEFAAASTDAELRAFVKTMQTGTDAEQQAAVTAATTKVLGP